MNRIDNFIPLGKDNAVSCARLAEKTGLTERDVQKAVLQARAEGYPICSTPSSGYYMPMSVDEALAYFRAQASRIKSGTVALSAIREYLRREASREQWEQLASIEQEFSDTTKTACGAGTTTDGTRD